MLEGVRPFCVQARRRPHVVDDASRLCARAAAGAAPRGGEATRAGGEARGPGGEERGGWRPPPPWPMLWPGMPRGAGLAIVLVVLFLAVAAGAYPVVRRLTRRLEALKRGVEQFGAGALDHRVAISGADEVAAVAASFNVAAARVEALVQSHRSLLANASHELRSPLARMKMAVSMLAEATPAERDTLKREIDTNVAELDGLVEEVLLASRLDVAENPLHHDRVDLLALAAEEAARVGAHVESTRSVHVDGDERLLRRAVRNLLENAQRYGGGEVEIGLGHVRCAGATSSRSRSAIAAPASPRRCASASSSRSFACPAMPSRPAASASASPSSSRSPIATAAACAAKARAGGGSCFVIEVLPAGTSVTNGIGLLPQPLPREGRAGSVGAACAASRRSFQARSAGQADARRRRGRASPSTRSRARRASTPG